MTPTEDLINEHKAIKVMLSIMSKIAENIKANKGYYIKDVEQIVDFLKIFADKCHHGKEENVLFPALVLAGIPKENGPIGVMLQEHTLGRGYIKEINRGLENCKLGDTCSSELIAANLTNYVRKKTFCFLWQIKHLVNRYKKRFLNNLKKLRKML
jgi:hemerythrin-like domain-containing protein